VARKAGRFKPSIPYRTAAIDKRGGVGAGWTSRPRAWRCPPTTWTRSRMPSRRSKFVVTVIRPTSRRESVDDRRAAIHPEQWHRRPTRSSHWIHRLGTESFGAPRT